MKILIFVLIAAAVLVLLLFAVCAVVFNELVWHKTIPVSKFITGLLAGNDSSEKSFETDSKRAFDYISKMPMESLQLKAENGERLKANLILPEKSNSRVIIACHGARSSGLGEFRFMADYFKKGGYTVLLPEHRGCGHSDGKYMGYGTHESADTLLWLDYVKKRFPGYSVFLMGVSMGAATVLMMSDKIKDNSVCGIVADCSYTSAWDEFSYQLKTSFHLPDFPVLYICDLYCKIFCGYSFKDAAPIKSVKNTSIPILFIHGKSDDYVPFYMQKQLYDSCSSEKYILPVDGAVHARSYYTNPEIYEKSINAFFDKYDKGLIRQ